MTDLYDLQVALDPSTARADDRSSICALEVPTKEEVWAGIKKSPRTAWEASIDSLVGVSESVSAIEMPEFGGM
tara:strand:- start:1068 stop:1286 length:219 start_codon:yes stop_codon:yes gene_type:complete